MREKIKDQGLLEDILEYSNNVIEFTKELTLDCFISDKRTYYAVMKNIEIIGEASYKLTHAFRTVTRKHPGILFRVCDTFSYMITPK